MKYDTRKSPRTNSLEETVLRGRAAESVNVMCLHQRPPPATVINYEAEESGQYYRATKCAEGGRVSVLIHFKA